MSYRTYPLRKDTIVTTKNGKTDETRVELTKGSYGARIATITLRAAGVKVDITNDGEVYLEPQHALDIAKAILELVPEEKK